MKKIILSAVATLIATTSLQAYDTDYYTKRSYENCSIAFQISDVINNYNKQYCSSSKNDTAMRYEIAESTNKVLTTRYGKVSNTSIKNLGVGIETSKDLSVFSVNYQNFICKLKQNKKGMFNYLTFINGRLQKSYDDMEETTNRNWSIEDSIDIIKKNELKHQEIFSSAYFIEKIMLSNFFTISSIREDKALKKLIKYIYFNDIDKAVSLASKYRKVTNNYITFCRNRMKDYNKKKGN